MKINVKQVLLMLLLIFTIMILFLAVVMIGNRFLPDRYTAAQYLLWILSGLLSFVVMPLLAYMSYRKPGPGKSGPLWNSKDNLFFAGLCLPVSIILFWAFGNLEHHHAVYNFFVDIFGKGRKGNPNFPIPLSGFLAFVVFGLAELLYNKIRYKVYEFPEFNNARKQETFRRRRSIYYSVALATCIICFIGYYLKWVALIN